MLFELPWTELVTDKMICDSACRTDFQTISTKFTIQLFPKRWSNDRIESAIDKADGMNVLDFITDPDTLPAKNATICIEDQNITLQIFRFIISVGLKATFCRPIGKRHILQRTFATAVTNRTIKRMVQKEQFKIGLSRIMNFWGFGQNLHSI